MGNIHNIREEYMEALRKVLRIHPFLLDVRWQCRVLTSTMRPQFKYALETKIKLLGEDDVTVRAPLYLALRCLARRAERPSDVRCALSDERCHTAEQHQEQHRKRVPWHV
eukprot:2379753-Rhodomonas_salina.2